MQSPERTGIVVGNSAADRAGVAVSRPETARLAHRTMMPGACHRTASVAVRLAAMLLLLLSARPGEASAQDDPVNDPFFGNAPGGPTDQQWHLKNDGTRQGAGNCGTAVRDMDVQVDTLQYWYTAVGRPSVVIGMIDVGVAGYHEDLAEVAQFGAFPRDSIDCCGSHGTKMAGLAAALTNNARGVAGVCPRCSIADIMLARPTATPEQCRDGSDLYLYGADASRYIEQALEWSIASPEFELAAFNIAVGGLPWRETMDILWRAYLEEGVVTAMACGALQAPCNRPDLLQTRPFILGVGGFTWTGEFWCPDTDCQSATETPIGTRVGPRHVDICGPARGTAMSTHFDPAIPYALTNLSTSGATACVSGALGLLRAYARDAYPGEELPPPGYMAGFITGSALDFPVDPTTYPNACPGSPRSHYGPGRLNIAGAVQLLEAWYGPRDGHYYHEEVLDYRDATIKEAERFTLGETLCVVERLSWPVQIPFLSDRHLPDRVAFVLPEACTVYGEVPSALGVQETLRQSFILHQARRDIRGAHLDLPDPGGGSHVTGWLCRISLDGGRSWNYLGTTREEATAVYAFLAPYPPDDPPAAAARQPFVFANPAKAPMILHWTGDDRRERGVEIYDLFGHRLRSLHLRRWQKTVTWDGRDDSGRELPAGVYWLREEGAAGWEGRRVVLVK